MKPVGFQSVVARRNVWVLSAIVVSQPALSGDVGGTTLGAVSVTASPIAERDDPSAAPDDPLPGAEQAALECQFSCGDGQCCQSQGEGPCTCPVDCVQPFCGDGICCFNDENWCNCRIDCGGYCGDGICCPDYENQCDCPADCGADSCGDGTCCITLGENHGTCPNDCGSTCGNSSCEAGENPCNCPADCGYFRFDEFGRCFDAIDNDCDGWADCPDPDCSNEPACEDACMTDADCVDADACTCDRCVAKVCHNVASPYGDLVCDGVVDVDDILYLLTAFSGLSGDPAADIEPCGGDGDVDVDDILAELDAFSGGNPCGC